MIETAGTFMQCCCGEIYGHHLFRLRQVGVPHEHDLWECDCGETVITGDCEYCGAAHMPLPNSCVYLWCDCPDGPMRPL